MNIYFIDEQGSHRLVTGSVYSIYQDCITLTEEQKHNSGFVGAIDGKGKLRGTLLVHQYRGKFRNALFDFVRKYKGIEAMEAIAGNTRRELTEK